MSNGLPALVSGVNLAKQKITERLHEQTGRRIFTEWMGADLHKVHGQKNTAVRKNVLSALIRKSLKDMPDVQINRIDFLNEVRGDSVEIRLNFFYQNQQSILNVTL